VTREEERLLAALAGMCVQYLEENGVLDHMWMGAGEDAMAVLADYGLIEVAGRGGSWTKAGRAFLEAH
jgi:hypothetical protein